MCLNKRHWFLLDLEPEVGDSRMSKIESSSPDEVDNYRSKLWPGNRHGLSCLYVPLMARRRPPIQRPKG